MLFGFKEICFHANFGFFLLFRPKQIIALTNKLKIQCIFVGNEFYSINKSSYKNVDFLTKYLKKNPLKNQTILIKGSRGIALEKIANYL